MEILILCLFFRNRPDICGFKRVRKKKKTKTCIYVIFYFITDHFNHNWRLWCSNNNSLDSKHKKAGLISLHTSFHWNFMKIIYCSEIIFGCILRFSFSLYLYFCFLCFIKVLGSKASVFFFLEHLSIKVWPDRKSVV